MEFTQLRNLPAHTRLLLTQGSHGFIKTHKWNNTIGAFINIEASGSGGAGIFSY
jgi:hypothetical protein